MANITKETIAKILRFARCYDIPIPRSTGEDNDKILKIVNGKPTWVEDTL